MVENVVSRTRFRYHATTGLMTPLNAHNLRIRVNRGGRWTEHIIGMHFNALAAYEPAKVPRLIMI